MQPMTLSALDLGQTLFGQNPKEVSADRTLYLNFTTLELFWHDRTQNRYLSH
jgi:hypothetical protein